MNFAEKLKQLRTKAGYTQPEVAQKIGVSYRAYQNYEMGKVYPKNSSIYGKLAALFDVTADFLLSDEDRYIIDAIDKGGSKVKREVKELLTQAGGLFAGGELTEDDKDLMMKAMMELYWESKDINKKYTPKKYRKEE